MAQLLPFRAGLRFQINCIFMKATISVIIGAVFLLLFSCESGRFSSPRHHLATLTLQQTIQIPKGEHQKQLFYRQIEDGIHAGTLTAFLYPQPAMQIYHFDSIKNFQKIDIPSCENNLGNSIADSYYISNDSIFIIYSILGKCVNKVRLIDSKGTLKQVYDLSHTRVLNGELDFSQWTDSYLPNRILGYRYPNLYINTGRMLYPPTMNDSCTGERVACLEINTQTNTAKEIMIPCYQAAPKNVTSIYRQLNECIGYNNNLVISYSFRSKLYQIVNKKVKAITLQSALIDTIQVPHDIPDNAKDQTQGWYWEMTYDPYKKWYYRMVFLPAEPGTKQRQSLLIADTAFRVLGEALLPEGETWRIYPTEKGLGIIDQERSSMSSTYNYLTIYDISFKDSPARQALKAAISPPRQQKRPSTEEDAYAEAIIPFLQKMRQPLSPHTFVAIVPLDNGCSGCLSDAINFCRKQQASLPEGASVQMVLTAQGAGVYQAYYQQIVGNNKIPGSTDSFVADTTGLWRKQFPQMFNPIFVSIHNGRITKITGSQAIEISEALKVSWKEFKEHL